MPISRREFIEVGVLSSAEVVLTRRLNAERMFHEVGVENPMVSSIASVWPRQPDKRLEMSFNHGWQFYRPRSDEDGHGEMPPKDVEWQSVTLPHTVRLEPLNAGGGRNYQGICWYQKHFPLEAAWKDKVLYLLFQGAMQVTDMWLNGARLPTFYGGYLPFTLDISRAARYDKPNVLTVRLDNSDNPEVPPGKPQNQLDFCYFGGLYRSVSLRVTEPLFITDPILANKKAGGGIFVTYPHVSRTSATVQVRTDLLNSSSRSRNCIIKHELFGPDGVLAATSTQSNVIGSNASSTVTQQIEVHHPLLWHPDSPNLYVLHTSVIESGDIVDDVYTRIGIKTFRFDREGGLFINGEPFFSVGANRHQDHPYVGYALPASAHFRDAKKLRDQGFSSYRIHYPQDPAFMDACDELGILAIVSNPGWQFMGDEVFKNRVYQNAREMIRRDRNRPSVIMWEAQLNETNNVPVAAELYRIVHEEYPGPDCYSVGDRVREPVEGFPGWDVQYNYYDNSKPRWIREWGDSVDNWTDQQSSVRVQRSWGEVPMQVQVVNHLQALDRIWAERNAPVPPGVARVAGADLWCGIDYYRGYNYQPFFGAPLDLFRLHKFDYHFFQSQRSPDLKISNVDSGPMVFIANLATHYSPTILTVFSNCQQVRLLQNGKEIGLASPDSGYSVPHPPFIFRVMQFSKKVSMLYANGIAAPGTEIGDVIAEGLIDGKVVARHQVLSPGVPTQIQLKLDDCGRPLTADGSDWIRAHAHICDSRGTTYPLALTDSLVLFEAEGEGTIIEDSRIRANPAQVVAGVATILLRATNRPGDITIRASAFGLKPAELRFESVRSLVPAWPQISLL